MAAAGPSSVGRNFLYKVGDTVKLVDKFGKYKITETMPFFLRPSISENTVRHHSEPGYSLILVPSENNTRGYRPPERTLTVGESEIYGIVGGRRKTRRRVKRRHRKTLRRRQ